MVLRDSTESQGEVRRLVSCRIFEHFALQTDPVTKFIKLKSAPCKEGIWCQN